LPNTGASVLVNVAVSVAAGLAAWAALYIRSTR
jgi:hypothetical protein